MNKNIFSTLEHNYIDFENTKINVIIDKKENIWFNANQIAIALGYKDVIKSLKQHVDKIDMTRRIDINKKLLAYEQPNSRYINESGMYSLIMKSTKPIAKKFNRWITHDVLPSIRKYGYYKLREKYKHDKKCIMQKINALEQENKQLKQDLSNEKYPNGGIVYCVNYSDNTHEIYRIGMTHNLTERKKVYNTHTLHSHPIVIMKQTECPIVLETCVRSMLYKFRYKNKKDFYMCELTDIEKAFRVCAKSIKCMEQKGGMIDFQNEINDQHKKLAYINKKIALLEKIVNTQ